MILVLWCTCIDYFSILIIINESTGIVSKLTNYTPPQRRNYCNSSISLMESNDALFFFMATLNLHKWPQIKVNTTILFTNHINLCVKFLIIYHYIIWPRQECAFFKTMTINLQNWSWIKFMTHPPVLSKQSLCEVGTNFSLLEMYRTFSSNDLELVQMTTLRS